MTRLRERILLFIASLLLVGLVACGDTFRPIITPEGQPGGTPALPRIAVVVNHAAGGTGRSMHINVPGDTVAASVELGAGPVHAALVGTDTYVANRNSDSVTSYTTGLPFNLPVVTISLPAGAAPRFVEGRLIGKVYVAYSGSNRVGVIQTAQQVLTGDFQVGANPVAMVSSPQRQRLYVANQGDGTVSVVSTADDVVETTIPVGAQPSWLAISDDGSFVFVANRGSGTVSVIDTVSNQVTTTLTVGSGPSYLFYEPRFKRVFVTNTDSNSVTIIKADVPHPAAPTVLATITVGSAPVNVTALQDGSRAYVANSGSNTVTVINTNANTVQRTITVGAGPRWIAASPDSTKVYVANHDANTVSVVRTSDDTVLLTLPTPTPQPLFVAVTN